jgi:hypothetical protein
VENSVRKIRSRFREHLKDMRQGAENKALTMNITDVHTTRCVVDEALAFAFKLRAARCLPVCRHGCRLPDRMPVVQTDA